MSQVISCPKWEAAGADQGLDFVQIVDVAVGVDEGEVNGPGELGEVLMSVAFDDGHQKPLVEGVAVLLVFWLMLYWMYRRKLFLKV